MFSHLLPRGGGAAKRSELQRKIDDETWADYIVLHTYVREKVYCRRQSARRESTTFRTVVTPARTRVNIRISTGCRDAAAQQRNFPPISNISEEQENSLRFFDQFGE